MEDRRRQILTAAEALIRRDCSTDFAMKELAVVAGFSLATSYNLIGTKATVLYSLLNASVQKLMSESSLEAEQCLTPDSLRLKVCAATRLYTDDPNFYRPLIRFLEGVPDSINRPIFMRRALNFWCRLSEAYEDKVRQYENPSARDNASLMHTFFLGGLNLWAFEEMSGDEFVSSTLRASDLVFRLDRDS